ncbi:unnamed protein product [Paramecium pentaurelia]|uniref:Transmembrane protein n=1 Tax=Paramecium pentaurelia TaxID=43138 RepID=A0A8S1W6S6_9CILI|nr:unnamed protein product [Paramecium pentaurelia]
MVRRKKKLGNKKVLVINYLKREINSKQESKIDNLIVLYSNYGKDFTNEQDEEFIYGANKMRMAQSHSKEKNVSQIIVDRIIQTKQFQIVVLKNNAALNLIYYNIIQGIIQFILGISLLQQKKRIGLDYISCKNSPNEQNPNRKTLSNYQERD